MFDAVTPGPHAPNAPSISDCTRRVPRMEQNQPLLLKELMACKSSRMDTAQYSEIRNRKVSMPLHLIVTRGICLSPRLLRCVRRYLDPEITRCSGVGCSRRATSILLTQHGVHCSQPEFTTAVTCDLCYCLWAMHRPRVDTLINSPCPSARFSAAQNTNRGFVQRRPQSRQAP